jgi:hypothetical protein
MNRYIVCCNHIHNHINILGDKYFFKDVMNYFVTSTGLRTFFRENIPDNHYF